MDGITGATNATLSFVANERLTLLAVPILNNDLKEANRTFRVTVSDPVGATLGNQKTTTVTITDNDQGFQFESASHTVAEDAGAALLHVLRGTDAADSFYSQDLAFYDKATNNAAPLRRIGVTAVISAQPLFTKR